MLRVVEEVVDEMLLVNGRGGGWEATEAGRKKVHVEHGYLRPGAEGGFEAEFYRRALEAGQIKCKRLWGVTSVPPASPFTQILPISRLRHFFVFHGGLRNCIVGLGSTLAVEHFSYAIG